MIFKRDNKGYLDVHEIDIKTLDLDKTLDCGETFRWQKLSNGVWQGIVKELVILLRQDRENNIIYTNIPFDKKELFIDYFDLETNYSNIEKLSLTGDDFALDSIKAGAGIRILRQELWETIVSFIISQRNNIPKIKSSILKLCNTAGSNISISNRDLEKFEIKETSRELKAFPTPEQIVKYSKEIRQNCSLGYRADYIIELANSVYKYNSNKDDSKSFEKDLISLNKACQYTVLTSIRGIGPKVANCIMLFGLHYIDSFPIDTWMLKIADTYYNGVLNPEKYGEYAGIIQQYMFYNIRNK